MYEKQTYAKSIKGLIHAMQRMFDSEKAYEQMYSKYIKEHYNGKPIKKYLKLMNKPY